MRAPQTQSEGSNVMASMMRTIDVLRDYRDGNEWGWDTEFAWLDHHQGENTDRLAEDVAVNGIREPILLGNDGRVWDGHHRLAVAVRLGLSEVPVLHG